MKSILSVLFILFVLIANKVQAQTIPANLTCEYLENPLGIDIEKPRFSWQIISEDTGVLQQAYQVIAGNDSFRVENGEGNVWNSGAILSTTVPALYSGSPLQPFTRYFWKVKVQLQDGSWTDFSQTASFETGMMTQTNWKGDWISDTYDFNIKPAPYFRNEFRIQKKILSARAYIAAAGLYELYLNGEKVGNHRLDPMYTRFDRRTLYVTYDVTQNLRNGENAIGVILGNGWYNHQSTAVWYFDKAPWRARPKFCMDLRITYDDGSVEVVSTSGKWKTSPSPVIFNSIYTAEHYDARLEQPGWNLPGFDDAEWKNVLKTGAPSKNITAQVLHPIRNVTEIPAKKITQFSDRNYVVDFGRNMAGVTKLKIKGTAGTTIQLKHGERLYENGHVDLSNIDVHYRPTDDSDPFQTDIVMLSGKDDEFMPKFNYKGFQFVEVISDKPIAFSEENLTAYFMHSDVPPVGEISSSNETLNKTWKAANASYLSNLFGYPTDCPQREKNGWTGDAHINIETGLYNFDAITVYEKWMADHRDEQQPNGVLPAIIPTDGWGYHWANGPDWTSTIAVIPWNIYLFYGDIKILADNYENIKRYVDHIAEEYPTGITDWGLGDWVPVKSVTPKEFTSTAYYFVDATILAKAAKILGKHAESEKYFALAEKIKNALNEKYLNRETGMYGSGLQTELSFPLQWNLVPDDMRAKVAENLAKRVLADNKHIDVGLLGTKAILNALSENGYAGLAYEVAAQETFPSWGWWIVNGATTFYENWPLDAESDISMNHIMFGEINAWYYKALGGILPDEKNPGFKNVILKPHFVEGLNHFEAKHKGPYGTIVSSWEKQKRRVEYKVEIPAGSTATLFLKTNDLRENHQKLSENKNIEVVQNDGNQIILQLAPASYFFQIKQ